MGRKKYNSPSERWSYKVRGNYIREKMRERYWKIKKGKKPKDKWFTALMERVRKSQQERAQVREFLSSLKEGRVHPKFLVSVDGIADIIQKAKKYQPKRFHRYVSLLDDALKRSGWGLHIQEIKRRAGI
jgi:hypothetical protein